VRQRAATCGAASSHHIITRANAAALKMRLSAAAAAAVRYDHPVHCTEHIDACAAQSSRFALLLRAL